MNELQPDERIRLAVGMAGVSLFIILSLAGTGFYTKDYFDCRESVQHWQQQQNEAQYLASTGVTPPAAGALLEPRERLKRAKDRLLAIRQRLLTSAAMLVFWGGFACWVWHRVKRPKQKLEHF